MRCVRDSSEKPKLSPFSRAYLITTTTTEMIKGASIGFSRTVSKIGTAVGQLLKDGSSRTAVRLGCVVLLLSTTIHDDFLLCNSKATLLQEIFRRKVSRLVSSQGAQ